MQTKIAVPLFARIIEKRNAFLGKGWFGRQDSDGAIMFSQRRRERGESRDNHDSDNRRNLRNSYTAKHIAIAVAMPSETGVATQMPSKPK